MVVGLILITGLVFGQNQWAVDSSAISFKIRNAGIMVNGSFGGLEANIAFNPKQLKKSSITASVDAASVDTGIRLRNKHLRKPDFFDVEAFPRISIGSEVFRKKGKNLFTGDFTLSLKGKEGHVQFPFTIQIDGAYHILSGTFEIDRNDYDIGGESLLLGDSVLIAIWVKARKID